MGDELGDRRRTPQLRCWTPFDDPPQSVNLAGEVAKTATTDAADKTHALSSGQRGRRRHSAMIVPVHSGRANRFTDAAVMIAPPLVTAHFSMAGALDTARMAQRVARQFDRNVMFYRNRLATSAAFGQLRQTRVISDRRNSCRRQAEFLPPIRFPFRAVSAKHPRSAYLRS
jgi:hypothetical protein